MGHGNCQFDWGIFPIRGAIEMRLVFFNVSHFGINSYHIYIKMVSKISRAKKGNKTDLHEVLRCH